MTDVKSLLSRAEKHPDLDGDVMTPECLHRYQVCQYQVLKNVNFLQKYGYFSENFFFYRIKYPLTKNSKSCNNKNLQSTQKGAYKPAYKNFSKTSENQSQDIPSELAEIVAIWPELPVHIKAAIKALIQTHKESE